MRPHTSCILVLLHSNIAFFDAVKEKFQETTTEKKAEQMAELFVKTREQLLGYPQFRLKEYHAILNGAMEQLESWKGKLSAMAQKDEVEVVKKSFAIFNALTPLERNTDNSNVINMAVKQRITAVTGATATEINIEIRKFEEMRLLHAWLHRRAKKGMRLPANQTELSEMMVEDRPEISDKFKAQQKKLQRRAFR